MTVNNSTANRGYQLPHPSNLVSDDVNRLIAAFNAIDADVAAAILAIAGKAAATHGHVINDIAGLQLALDGKMGAGVQLALSALSDVDLAGIGANMFLRWNGSKVVPVSFDASMIASGTVATARLPTYLTSTSLSSSYAAASHAHAIADVTGLQTALNGKAGSAHTHAIADVTNLQSSLDGKAATSHTHAIANVTGLQAALDGKAASAHAHAIADVTNLQAALDGKAPQASPALTGIPTAPTAVSGTNSTQIATTAFVQSALSGGMTLLGTINTQSGSTQTITGLSLVGYSRLWIEFASVSPSSSTGQLSLADTKVYSPVANGNVFTGVIQVNLITSVASGAIGPNQFNTGNTAAFAASLLGVNKDTTSISVSMGAGTFDGGAVWIWGIK